MGSLLAATALAAAPLLGAAAAPPVGVPVAAADRAVTALIARHGEAQADRIRRGVTQVAQRWWPEDGDEAAFDAFVAEHFAVSPAELAAIADRLAAVFEQVDGHLHEVQRELTSPQHLDTGPLSPVDTLLADLDLASHVDPDLFRTKVAFLALLNFPVHTLEERLAQGASWDRTTWARSRMMDRFAARVPAQVVQQVTRAINAAEQYVAEGNVYMGRLRTAEDPQPFARDLRLIAHWGLRDELKSHYGRGEEGLRKQRIIQMVMERIVRSEVPSCVRNSDLHRWDPFTNEVRTEAGARVEDCPRDSDTRYARLLDVFRAVRRIDPYNPTAPTYVQSRFEQARQIPEREVEALLTSILEAREVAEAARVIQARLGRPLEPFDLWYSGFKPGRSRPEEELDRLVHARYPTVAAFQADLPRVLRDLGFSAEKADWLAGQIVVDPARGAGHAMGPVRRSDRAHLRTRIPAAGMDYKGYNIAIHELGHNVEQLFSLHGVDSWFLGGVPNNAFTEALAFVFQARDLELLGLEPQDGDSRRQKALDDLWGAYEIGGVALVDVRTWRWMYAHPEATAAELRQAVLGIAREVWNRWYAPVLGGRDAELLAVYAHMVSYPLYLPDYPLGIVIQSQVARLFREGNFGREFERIARQGRLTPDAWMRGAVGSPLRAQPLLEEAAAALKAGVR